ncbi:MAG: WD40/YVTN/BNR-like repeat-containing protein, partial [Ktedonobacteraceae bacterium]
TTGLMAASTPDTVLVSHDGGAKWTPQQLPTPDLTPQQLQRATQGQAIFFDRQNGIIPVNVFRDDQHISIFQYITHDGAKTWQISPTEDISTFGRACYLDAQNWVLMVNSTTLLRTADGGTSWRIIPMRTGFAYIDAISLAPNLEGWAIGRATQTLQGDQYNQDNSTTLLKTTDGGRTWVQPNYTVS